MIRTLEASSFSFHYKKRGFCPSFFNYLLFLLFFFFLAIHHVFAEIVFDDSFKANIEKKYGEYAKRRLVSWEKLLKDQQDKTEREKLESVNLFFNLFEFMSDLSHWGEEDYWASPLEFVVSGGGDCDDFSIAKYFTLLELGVPDEKMLIAYVKAIEINQAHMVLTYYETPSSMPLILDNLNGEILPADRRPDLVPVYSFNGKGLWQAKQRGLGNKIGEAKDLKRWMDMERRMKEGTIHPFR